MFPSVVAALALAASISQVASSPINHIARNYAQDAELLEDYTPYHVRYLALGCAGKHGSEFFESCCHPLLKWQKLSDRPSQCIPSASASSSAALAEPSAPVVDEEPLPETCDDDDDDEDNDDDECTDEVTSSYPTSSKAAAAAVTQSVVPTTKAASKAASPEPTYAAPTSTKAATSAAPETTKEATTYSAPEPTTTHKPSSTKPATTAEPTSSAEPSSGGGEVFEGGFATFFSQGGNAGACGDFHGDYDLIVAADSRRYGDLDKKSSLCGKKVLITNTDNGKQVTAVIADACPTCKNSNSLDLSLGAFDKIGARNTGMLPIKWEFV